MNDTRAEPKVPLRTVTIQAAVTQHPFFSGMSPAHLAVLAECAERTEFAAGTMIFRRGEAAQRFYLIEVGAVSVEIGDEARGTIFIQTLGAGEVLGWSWLLPPHHWRFDARAVPPTSAIYFYGAWLRELCADDAAFGYELMRRIVQVVVVRLQASREQLIELSQLALGAQCRALHLAGKDLNLKRKPTRKKL
jgi:CRP-like cAMP-binding protein